MIRRTVGLGKGGQRGMLVSVNRAVVGRPSICALHREVRAFRRRVVQRQESGLSSSRVDNASTTSTPFASTKTRRKGFDLDGAPQRIRTSDLRLRRPTHFEHFHREKKRSNVSLVPFL